MNPANNETSGIQLPPPVMEQPAGANLPEKAGQPGMSGAERPPQPSSPGAAMPVIPLPIPPVIPPATPPAAALPAAPTATLQASDDSDLIEKEWVNKAKQIVERTRDDPYRQSEELTVVKVDYMKKRYNKSIKLNK